MKKYLSYIGFLIITASCIAFISCDNDDDDSNKGGKGDYTLKYNGQTYYYGYYGYNLKLSIPDADYNYTGGHWSTVDDNSSILLLLDAQDQSHFFREYNETLGLELSKYNGHIECLFNIKDFNPKTAKKGDILTFDQYLDTRVGDMKNHIFYREQENRDASVTYSWQGEAIGKIKFVSYRHDYMDRNIITLEFQNLTMNKINTSNQSGPELATLNGEVIFVDVITKDFYK